MTQSSEINFQSAERYNVALMRYLKFRCRLNNEQIATKMKEINPDVPASEPTVSRFLNGDGNSIEFQKTFVLATGGDWRFISRQDLKEDDFHLAVRSGVGDSNGGAKARRLKTGSTGQKPRKAAA